MVKEFLIGDNPFIGVSHLAQAKAREEKNEATMQNKIEVIKTAIEGGATGFTFSTHESNLQLLRYIYDNQRDLLGKLDYYILVPYAQGYVRKANMSGTIGLIRFVLRDIVKKQFTDLLPAILTVDINKIASAFIGYEIKPYLEILPNHKIKAILIHEILTELIMAYDLTKLFKEIKGFVKRKLGIDFGLETRNVGFLYKYLLNKGLYVDYVMTPINPLGYQMAPNREEAEKCIYCLARNNAKIIAINILASGAISLEESINYLSRFKDIIFAVTSASTKPLRLYRNFKTLSDAFK